MHGSSISAARGRLSLHPDVAAAGLLCLLAASGLAVGALLTLLKFKSAYGCDLDLGAACALGGLFASCEAVLESRWASVMDVPISIPATAHYAVVLGLAAAVLIAPRRVLPVVRPLLLAFAWAGLLVVPPLALYAALAVHNLCSYCCVVYGINLAIFLAAWWMHPDGHAAGLAALRSLRRRTTAPVFAGLSFAALVLLQTAFYREQAASMALGDRCWREGELPRTSLHTDAQAPVVEIALFVDLACGHCRQEFEAWTQRVGASEGRYHLSVYHFPLAGECVPSSVEVISDAARYHHSCRAARTVECAERLGAGNGMRMIERLFAAQDGGDGPYFSRERLAALAQELGVVDTDGVDALLQCAEQDPDALQTIQEHVKFANDRGLKGTPGVFFVYYDDDGVALPYAPLYVGTKQYPADLEQYFGRARNDAMMRKEKR